MSAPISSADSSPPSRFFSINVGTCMATSISGIALQTSRSGGFQAADFNKRRSGDRRSLTLRVRSPDVAHRESPVFAVELADAVKNDAPAGHDFGRLKNCASEAATS